MIYRASMTHSRKNIKVSPYLNAIHIRPSCSPFDFQMRPPLPSYETDTSSQEPQTSLCILLRRSSSITLSPNTAHVSYLSVTKRSLTHSSQPRSSVRSFLVRHP